MPVSVVTARDAQPITVNALVSNPLIIPERIVQALENQFIMDSVLRYGGTASGGAVQYRVSTGLFADTPSEIVAPGDEIPLVTAQRGDLNSKPVQKRALGISVDREMISRNDVGEVNRQLDVLKNTLIRDFDGAFVTTLTSAVTNTRAATAAWSSGSATIRKDINAARLLITQALAPSTVGSNYLDYRPDTLLINPASEADLLNSTEFLQLLYGSANPQNTGANIDRPLLGLNVRVSPSIAAGTAWVLQSRVVGGYADEFPLQATELYEHRPSQTWRSDCSRSSVAFVDQPLAAAKITGV